MSEQNPSQLMVSFIGEVRALSKNMARNNELTAGLIDQLKQNNSVTKELYNVMDSFHQNVINYLKTSADINTVVGAATRLLKGR